MIGPPWVPSPPAWAIDDLRIPIVEPGVVDFVAALMVGTNPERLDPTLGALSTLYALTDSVGRQRLWLRTMDLDAPPIRRDLIERIADDVTAAVTGWPRWTLHRLWSEILGSWRIVDGTLQASQIDLTSLPLRQATAASFGVLCELYRQDDDAWRKWTAELDRKPPRQIRREIQEATAAEAAAAFAAVEAMIAGTPATPSPGDSGIVTPGDDTLNVN